MPIPKVMSNITNHGKPRYMLYQPGFNNFNSCWLNGGWINLPKKEWEKIRIKQEKMYSHVLKAQKNQHYRDKGITFKNMTPAQLQAWKYHSGNKTVYCMIHVNNQNFIQPISVQMAGNTIKKKDIKWMRKKGYKIIQHRKKDPSNNKESNQLKGLNDIPEDLIFNNEKSIDVRKRLIIQNKKQMNMVIAIMKSIYKK